MIIIIERIIIIALKKDNFFHWNRTDDNINKYIFVQKNNKLILPVSFFDFYSFNLLLLFFYLQETPLSNPQYHYYHRFPCSK